MEKDLQDQEALAKLKDLIDSVHICMYCTTDASGDITSRPMGTSKVEDDGTIWFFTTDHSGAAAEAGRETTACLNYAHPGKNTYLVVTGQSELVFDKAKMAELWNPMLKTWFPDGLETPDIALIRVTPDKAHYWESDASRIRLAYSFLRAQITGKPAQGTEGDHGELNV